MAKKPSGLLSEILSEPPIARGPKSWFVRMADGDDKQQLRDLHAAYHAGKLTGYSVLHLHSKAVELTGITIGTNGFEQWLRKANPDG